MNNLAEKFELLTVADLSKILKRKENTIYQDVMRRRIPFVKIGNLLRFDPAEIQKWIESKGVPAKR